MKNARPGRAEVAGDSFVAALLRTGSSPRCTSLRSGSAGSEAEQKSRTDATEAAVARAICLSHRERRLFLTQASRKTGEGCGARAISPRCLLIRALCRRSSKSAIRNRSESQREWQAPHPLRAIHSISRDRPLPRGEGESRDSRNHFCTASQDDTRTSPARDQDDSPWPYGVSLVTGREVLRATCSSPTAARWTRGERDR